MEFNHSNESISADITNSLTAAVSNALTAAVTNALTAAVSNALTASVSNTLTASVTNVAAFAPRIYTIPVGSGMQTLDGSGRASPITAQVGASRWLQIPSNAKTMIIYPAQDLRVSESGDMSSYFVIPSGGVFALDTPGLTSIRLEANSVSGELSFMFYV